MKLFGVIHGAGNNRAHSPTFSGKNRNGQPLQGHDHAYYLLTDEDGDGRLDHLTIVAEGGFDADELMALGLFRELRTPRQVEESHPLHVVLLGMGQLADYQAGPLQKSDVWVSVTPFIATRYLKKRGQKRDPTDIWNCPTRFAMTVLHEELERLCDRRADLPAVDSIAIEPLLDNQGVPRVPVLAAGQELHLRWRPIEFKRRRRKAGDDGHRRATGVFRLRFPRAVRGPICLGYASHFGMGLFYGLGR